MSLRLVVSGCTTTASLRRWIRALPRIAGALNEIAPQRVDQRPDLGDVAVAVAFDYVSFRLAERPWRTASPALARRVDAICARESMRSTRPV